MTASPGRWRHAPAGSVDRLPRRRLGSWCGYSKAIQEVAVQDRGLAAYIAELLGTLFLVFVVGTVVTLFVASSPDAQTGSDFAVVGLVHALMLFGLIMAFGAVSGGHFNPAITLAAAVQRKIDAVDAAVYMLAQLSGAVLGALLVKGILLDEGQAGGYGN